MSEPGSTLPAGHARRTDIATILIALVGALPGLLLPFAISASFDLASSDLLLLALSVTVTTGALVGSAIEINSIAVIGRHLGQGTHPSPRRLWMFRFRGLLYGLLVSLIATPVLVAVYATKLTDVGSFIAVVVVLTFAPIIGGYSSSVSGEAIALGKAHWAVGLQATKALVPLVLIVGFGEIPLQFVALAYVGGEVARAIILTLVCSRAGRLLQLPREHVHLATSGLVWQSSALAVAQAQPVVDRTFLVGEPGQVSSYEMGDKLMQAGAQLVTMGLLQRRIGSWSRLRAMNAADARTLLLRDARTVGAGAVLAAALLAAVCVLASGLPIVPDEWRTGILWGAILSASIPTLLVTVAGSRLLVVAGRQKLLIWFAAGGVVLTLVADLVLFSVFGPVGIILAAVIVRAILACVYLLVLRAVLPGVIGSDVVTP